MTALTDDDAETPADARGRFAWAFFEFARAPTFSLTMMFVFATYFTQTVAPDPVRGQALWSLAGTISGACIAFAAPVLGAIADRMGNRKPWLLITSLTMMMAIALLWFVHPGTRGGLGLPAIIAVVSVVTIAFQVTFVLHNAMLGSIVAPSRVGLLSGLGLALGNAGSFLSMSLFLFAFALPATGLIHWGFLPASPLLGLDPRQFEHSRVVGPFAALWFLTFAAPMFLWTPDRASTRVSTGEAVRGGLRQLLQTLRQLRGYANIARFLLAQMFYQDGIVALQVYCAIYAAGTFGWDVAAVLIFGLLIALTCFGGALLGGAIDHRIGSRKATIIFLCATCLLLVVSVLIQPDKVFGVTLSSELRRPLWDFPYFRTLPELLFLGAFLTLALAASVVLVSARAMLARIAPRSLMTQFFGLFALSGTATAFLGHGLVAFFTASFASQRAGFLAPIILLALGMMIMVTVREERAREPGGAAPGTKRPSGPGETGSKEISSHY